MANERTGVITVVAAVIIQLCLGTAYVWSVFQNGIAESIFSGDNAAAGLAFSLLLANLPIGSTIGGKLKNKFGSSTTVIIGGLLIALGFFLSSFVKPSAPWVLWVTYGIIGGIGMGIPYSTTIACAQEWYPHKKGFITGIIVAALGFGGVIFAPVNEWLIKLFGGVGVGELKTFLVLSIVFAVVGTIGGIFIKNPPKGYLPEGYIPPAINSPGYSVNYSPSQILRMPQFYILVVTFLLACMGGVMMIGFAKPIAIAKDMASTATIGVITISVCNSMGRLFWGGVSDKLGRKRTIIILLLGSGVLSLFVNMANGYLIYVLIGFIGFFYGGFLSTFPAYTADLFGSKHMVTNYGMVMIGFGLGAIISSYIAGYFKNLAATDISLMFPAFIIASIAAAMGIILISTLKKPESKITD